MDKYLLEILKESNTIIIPGLGALTITNQDTGEIMFMPYLQHDNGKLAEFIAEKDGIDEADAKIMVAKYVREIKSELDKGESYTMFELGEFVKADDGDVEFTYWSELGANKEEESTETPASAAVLEEVTETPVVEEVPEVIEEPIEEVSEETLEFEPLEIEEESPIEFEGAPLSEAEEEIKETIEEEVTDLPEIPEQLEDGNVELNSEEEAIKNTINETIDTTAEVESIQPEEPISKLSSDELEIKQSIEEAIDETPIDEENIDLVAPFIETPDPEPTYQPEEPKLSEEEEEIKHVILDAVGGATATDHDPYPKDLSMEPAAVVDDGPKLNEAGEVIEEEEEEKKKEKAGAGFWIMMIVIALLIIAGGAYVGRNYNELKQHIPFLADDTTEDDKEESLKEEMFKAINEDKNTSNSNNNDSSDGSDMDSNPDDEEMPQVDEETQPETTTPPVVEKPEPVVVEKPKVKPSNISSSSSGPFKVIAGAFSSEANANRLAAEFKAKGLKSEVFKKGELFTVSMQSYATTEEANANLPKLQSMAPGAWILYKN